MKRILILSLGVLLLAGAVSAQPYWTLLDALNAIERQADSLATLASAPTPVTVSEHVIFSGLSLRQFAAGTLSNLDTGFRTFPASGAPDVHGAKALYLVLDWTDYDHGGFTIEHKFGPSSADTLFQYWDGGMRDAADTIGVSDSLGRFAGILPNVAGSLVLRVPDVPGAGYYYTKITAWGTAHANYITGLSATLVVVQ